MFNEDTDTGDHLCLGFVVGTQLLSAWFFLWLIGTNMLRVKPLEACIFQEHTTRRKGVAFLITNAFVMHAASNRPTARTHETLFTSNHEVIFHGVGFFLPLYFSFCSMVSCGRWRRRAVPSMMKSTATQSAKVCSRCFGSLAGTM